MKGNQTMTQNCLGTIRSSYSKFSEKEKKIADYILEKPETIIHRTINEVADDLNIADATVFRFSKRIGFKGFQAMKIALASEVITPVRSIQEEITEEDIEKNLTEKIFKLNIRSLQNTLGSIDNQSIKKAIDLIQHANRIEFYGSGLSSIIAMNASFKFMSIGMKASACMDSNLQTISASNLTKNDVAIIISHSGSNQDTITILKTINETGAKTIGITSSLNSPISLNVDIALYTSTEETENLPAGFSSQITQLALIDALCSSIIKIKKKLPQK
ncbi:MAG: MurR/RpiR family transcriptional regulator [Bacillota bacterium]|nr:MurR/RpiR family transcriptional regulator [Bacillota bacterium]